MNLKNLDRKDVLIGGGVVLGAAVIYTVLRPKDAPTVVDPTPDLPPIARSATSADAAAPIVSGGGYGAGGGMGIPDGYTMPPGTKPPETSPLLSSPVLAGVGGGGDSGYYDDYYSAPVPSGSPAPESPTYSPPVMPSYFTPGFVPYFGSPLWAIASKGYRLIGPGSNSNGTYNTWEFWYSDGHTNRGNFYTSGAKKGMWVGPF